MWPFKKPQPGPKAPPAPVYWGYAIPAGVSHHDRKSQQKKIRELTALPVSRYFMDHAEACSKQVKIMARTGVHVEVFPHGVKS